MSVFTVGSLGLIVPYTLANLVVWATLLFSGAPAAAVPVVPVVPVAPAADRNVTLRSQWPFDFDPVSGLPLTVTAQLIGFGAAITLPDGSSNADSLAALEAVDGAPLTFSLDNDSNAIELGVKSTAYIYVKAAAGSGGYVQFITRGLNNSGPVDRRIDIGTNTISIPVADILSLGSIDPLITFGTDSAAEGPTRFLVWSAEEPAAIHNELAVVAPVLDFSYAGLLAVRSGFNDGLMVRIGAGAPWRSCTVAFAQTLTPAVFVEALQAALDSLPGNPINVSLIGALRPEETRVVSIQWQNVGAIHDVWIRVPSLVYEPAVSLESTLATAATYGLFERQTGGPPRILAADPEDPMPALPETLDIGALKVPASAVVSSPSPTVLQWPMIRPICAYAGTGTADTDGSVDLQWTTSGGGSGGHETFAADLRPYVCIGPTAVLGPFTSSAVYWPGYRPASATLSIKTEAVTQTLQTVALHGLTLRDEHGALAFFYGENPDITLTMSVNGTLIDLDTGPFATLFDSWGRYTGATVASVTVDGPITDTLRVGLTATTSSAGVLFTGWFSVALGGPHVQVRRYTPDNAPALFTALPGDGLEFRLVAYGAGGGSWATPNGAYKGGPTGGADVTVRCTEGALGTLVIQVGSRGTVHSDYAATGGTATWVRVRGQTSDVEHTVIDLGGGGGAARGSHGGGAPAGSIAGLSASETAFQGFPFVPVQFFGPDATPKPYLGAGSALDDTLTTSQDGRHGTIAVGSQASWNLGPRGGLGGQGASPLGLRADLADQKVFGGSGAKTMVTGSSGGARYGAGGGGGSLVMAVSDTLDAIGFVASSAVVEPTGHALTHTYCNRASMLSTLLEHRWGRAKAKQWAARIATAAAGIYGAVSVDTKDALVDPLHSTYMPPAQRLITDYESIEWQQHRAPVGPHEAYPGQEGLELRVRGLRDNGFTVILESPPRSLQVGSVIEIQFGVRSIVLAIEPDGTGGLMAVTLSSRTFHAGLHLRLLANNDGPSTGFQIRATCAAALLGTSSTPAQSVAIPDAAEVAQHIWSMMPHIDFQGTFWSPTEYCLPVMPYTNAAPYLASLWPMGPRADLTDFLTVTATARLGVPSTPIEHFGNYALSRHEPKAYSETFVYTGQLQSCSVPPSSTLRVTATGAPGADLGHARGAPGSTVETALRVAGTAGTAFDVYVGQPGGTGAPIAGLSGGLSVDGTIALGGGLSGLYDSVAKRWILVAAGGGSAGRFSDGLVEASVRAPHRLDGRVGLALSTDGSNAPDEDSGAGGSGFRGGTAGHQGFAGASGRSFGGRPILRGATTFQAPLQPHVTVSFEV